jgi:hypothetical protein
MGAFRRIEDERAGPAALGILVPPGRRTFLILRPRSLAWDLLLVRPDDGAAFQDMSREEATVAAQRLYRALGAWAGGGPGRVEAVPAPETGGFRLRAVVASFALLACPREPGKPYRPLVLPDGVAAREAADALARALCPPDGVEQELYFNGRNFAR